MGKEFNELLKSSKKVIGDVEKKVEDVSGDFAEDVGELWKDMKKGFTNISNELLGDDNKEKAQEKVLEAKEKLNYMKDSVTEFATNLKSEHQGDLDTAALRAHLAKMDAEDFVEENRKKVSREVQESSQTLEQMALDASKEIKDFFSSLSDQFSKKA